MKKPTKGQIQRARRNSRKYLKAICEKCGEKKALTIHHLIPLSLKIVVRPFNCITLCRDCHKETEKRVQLKRLKIQKLKKVII